MLVLTEAADGIITITMNRPDKRNALSPELIDALGAALGRVEAAIDDDDAVRVVVLAGAGTSFCAGMDLRGVISDPEAMARMLHGLARFTGRLRRLPVPTIARVQGAAIGGGCGLSVVTDFTVTHPEAKVGYPEVSLGVCPAVVAPWLIRRIGAGPARAMLLGGGTITGAEGHAIGLATHLVERERLDEATVELARHLATGGRDAMAVTKRWVNELDDSLDDDVLTRAADLSAQVIATDEAQTRLKALLGG